MKLIVLDFQKNITYVYTKLDKRITMYTSDIEKVLYDLGHNSSNCQWMLTKNEIIIK
jgi:DNA-directed RNA polymerase subunit N (RpoN/RPB10)